MGLPKKIFASIKKSAESQGAEVGHARGGGLRIKSPGGRVIIVHSSPTDNDSYLMHMRRNFTRAGLTPPEKW